MTVEELTSRCFLFRKLDLDTRQSILDAGRVYRVAEGAYFFHQGEDATHMYLLCSGRVKLVQLSAEGEQVVINYFGPGQGLGIIVALNNTDYPLSAVALEDVEAVAWHRDDMHALMLQHPQLALNGMQMMGERFTRLQARFRDVSTRRVEQRIGRALLRLVRQFGRRVDEGVLIDIPLSRQDIAEMTGTNIYNVSRILSKWEQQGWIVSHRKQIILRKAHELVVLAEDLTEEADSNEQETG